MSNIRLPYQCLQICGQILTAASGSSIDSYSLDSRSLLSSWKPSSTLDSKNSSSDKKESALDSPNAAPQVIDSVDVAQEPIAKRRKLSVSEETEPPKQKNEKAKPSKRHEAVTSGLEFAPVVNIAATEGGRHVIVVTGEDKSIIVFENVNEQGGKHELKQLSQRAMPKRPCAITITNDSSTIISADKFGDVFSLPLLLPSADQPRPAGPLPDVGEIKLFVPSANNLTVHSQRNRIALENQKRQTNKPAKTAPPVFTRDLLLGHVSMLTDVLSVTLNEKRYIITADRDEHIRVSRGIPQAHIIEQFCLGHTEFVSRLCVPASRPEILISGGGDDDLFVWDWVAGILLSKADLKSHVELIYNANGKADSEGSVAGLKIAVSNISHVKIGDDDLVLVTCEGIPALFTFLLTASNTLQQIQRLQLPGNPLSFVTFNETLIISVDNVHQPFSTTELRDSASEPISPLQAYEFEDQRLSSGPNFEVPLLAESETNLESVKLGNLLYNLENLRKREGDWKEEQE